MDGFIDNLITGARLVLGRRADPARLHATPGQLAALLALLLALAFVAAVAATVLAAAPPGSAAVPLALVLAGLAAARADAALATMTGLAAAAAAIGLAAVPLGLVAALAGPPWGALAVGLAALAGLAVALWRLSGGRALAVAAGLALLAGGAAWPLAERGAAAVAAAAQRSPRDRAEAAVARGFDRTDIAAALIAQPARIDAAAAALPVAEGLVLSLGGSGWQTIFDREARRAAAVLAARGAGPALVLSNTPAQAARGLLASRDTAALAMAALGRRLGPDGTLTVFLTSHGGADGSIAMDAPRLDFAPLDAPALAAALDRAGIRRRIVIVSACYGGAWIAPLRSRDTIVLAAAAADRVSFGCDDTRELTVFGEALLRELAAPGRSLQAAFTAAQVTIAGQERAAGLPPSRPQAFVGANMQGVWTRAGR